MIFSALFENLVCKRCGRNMTFTEASQRGLGFKLVISCEKIYVNSCPLINNAYEVNRRIIFAMRLLGIGLNGIIKFCDIMDLPRPIYQPTYDCIINIIICITIFIYLFRNYNIYLFRTYNIYLFNLHIKASMS